MSAADVHPFVDASEIIRVDDCRTVRGAVACHRIIEVLCGFRVFGQIVKEGFAVDFLEGGQSGLHTIAKFTIDASVPIRAKVNRKVAHTVLHIAAQRFREWGQMKAPALVFGENADACQRPQQAIERSRLYAELLRQFVCALRLLFEQIRDAEFGGDS